MTEECKLFDFLKSLNPVSVFIPFGTCCLPAKMIENVQLRRFSLPMDWLFTTNSMLAHCIDDDFETFLDKANYSFIPLEERPWGEKFSFCHHSFYKENHYAHYVFNHFNPLEDSTYETLKRRTNRLINIFRSSQNKVFFNFSHGSTSEEGFIFLHNAIKRKYENFSLIMISYKGISTNFELVENVKFLDQSCFFEFHSFSKFIGERFHSELDNSFIKSLFSWIKKGDDFNHLKE